LTHTLLKPGRGPITDLVVYRCEVPRSKLRRFKAGIWRCFESVRPIGMEPAAVYGANYPSDWPVAKKGVMFMIGEQVRQALKQAIEGGKLSQAELARRTGLTEATVSRIVSGEREPSGETIDKLMDALGMEVVIKPKRKGKGE
jgi:DNA-binding phage protein